MSLKVEILLTSRLFHGQKKMQMKVIVASDYMDQTNFFLFAKITILFRNYVENII